MSWLWRLLIKISRFLVTLRPQYGTVKCTFDVSICFKSISTVFFSPLAAARFCRCTGPMGWMIWGALVGNWPSACCWSSPSCTSASGKGSKHLERWMQKQDTSTCLEAVLPEPINCQGISSGCFHGRDFGLMYLGSTHCKVTAALTQAIKNKNKWHHCSLGRNNPARERGQMCKLPVYRPAGKLTWRCYKC